MVSHRNRCYKVPELTPEMTEATEQPNQHRKCFRNLSFTDLMALRHGSRAIYLFIFLLDLLCTRQTTLIQALPLLA